MKIEIEVPVDAIKQELQKQVAEAVAAHSSHWESRDYIKAQIKAHWRGAVDDAIRAALADSPAIKAAIREEIEKKLKAQITKLMKEQ